MGNATAPFPETSPIGSGSESFLHDVGTGQLSFQKHAEVSGDPNEDAIGKFSLNASLKESSSNFQASATDVAQVFLEKVSAASLLIIPTSGGVFQIVESVTTNRSSGFDVRWVLKLSRRQRAAIPRASLSLRPAKLAQVAAAAAGVVLVAVQRHTRTHIYSGVFVCYGVEESRKRAGRECVRVTSHHYVM